MVRACTASRYRLMVRGTGSAFGGRSERGRRDHGYSPGMQSGAPVTPEIVDRAVFLDEVDLAPDGRTAYVVRRSTAGIEYQTEIWTVTMDGGEPAAAHGRVVRHAAARLARRETGGVPGKACRFRREGRRGRAGERQPGDRDGARRHQASGAEAQVWVLDVGADAAAAWQLTREEHDVSGFAWSPDGSRIAFWGWRGPARFLVGARDDDKAPTARHITVGGWRWNEIGHLDYRTHLSAIDVVETPGGRRSPRATTTSANPAWDADGTSLAVLRGTPRTGGHVSTAGDLARGCAARGEPLEEPVEVLRLRGVAERRYLPPTAAGWRSSAWTRTGRRTTRRPRLFVAPADGSARPSPWHRTWTCRSAPGRTATSTAGTPAAPAGAFWRDSRRAGAGRAGDPARPLRSVALSG